jgi:hypothetical protein
VGRSLEACRCALVNCFWQFHKTWLSVSAWFPFRCQRLLPQQSMQVRPIFGKQSRMMICSAQTASSLGKRSGVSQYAQLLQALRKFPAACDVLLVSAGTLRDTQRGTLAARRHFKCASRSIPPTAAFGYLQHVSGSQTLLATASDPKVTMLVQHKRSAELGMTMLQLYCQTCSVSGEKGAAMTCNIMPR